MKNTMLLSILSALLFTISCTTKTPDITPTTTWLTTDSNQPTATTTTGIVQLYANDTWVTIGDTTIPKKTVTLHPINATAPDLSALKNTIDNDLKGKPLRMVSIGGSLTAGMQNGGLYQESQLTSYPNLIARQMQLVSFIQPLFTNKEYNGYGYKLPTSSNTIVPKYNAVKNNTAYQGTDTKGNVLLNTYLGGQFDNFAVPFGGLSVSSGGYYTYLPKFLPYLGRILDKNTSVSDAILIQKFDVMLFEDSSPDFLIQALQRGLINTSLSTMNLDGPYNSTTNLILKLKNKVQVLMANTPDITDFPYFNLVTLDKIRQSTGTNLIYYRIPNGKDAWLADNTALFIPNSSLDSLLNPTVKTGKKGFTKALPLEDKDVLTLEEIQGVQSYISSINTFYAKWLTDNGFPTVDLYTLYKNIINGNYTSNGVKVTKDNFFSSDGINPTALGQAVIANEFIKTMNTFYKTNIPLINVSYYQK